MILRSSLILSSYLYECPQNGIIQGLFRIVRRMLLGALEPQNQVSMLLLSVVNYCRNDTALTFQGTSNFSKTTERISNIRVHVLD